MKRLIVILVSILASVELIPAQEHSRDTLDRQSPTKEYVYPTEIVVTGSRMNMPLKDVPFSTSIVGSETFKSLPRSIAVDEPLKLVPGVKVDNQANGSRVHVSMRGQGILTERGIRGIRVMLDGFPVNDPTGFAPDFFDVDFSAVDRIEVQRGPAASIYGGSASGGIINITTESSPNIPLFGEANGSFGSNNFQKGFGRFGGNVNNVNYSVSFSRSLGDGYREHTHFWGDNVYAKAIYTPSEFFQVSPVFCWTDVYHENPEGINLEQYRQDPRQPNPDAIPFNEYLETERGTYGLNGVVNLRDGHEVQFSGYVKRTQFTEANNRTFNHRTYVTPGGSLQYTLSSGESSINNRFSVGADLQWQAIDEHRVDNVYAVEGDILRSKETIKQRGTGVFVVDRLSVDDWGFMASVRYDEIHNELNDVLRSPYDLSGKADFSKATGRIGLTYYIRPEATLYANWGQGFMPPATEELAQNPDNYGGFNTHLVSATSTSYELGFRGEVNQRQLFYDISGFYLTTENDFDRYRITDPNRIQETFYRNAGSSKRFGVEMYARYEPVRSTELQLAYTYSHFKYANAVPLQILMDDPDVIKYIVDGNWLPNSPMHQLYVDMKYAFPSGFYAGVSMELQSKTYIDGANVEEEAAKGYTLLHARVGYNWHLIGISGDLSVHVRNIGDTQYVAFTEPDPGGNSYQPGARREFFGTLRIQL
jgi:iron complex outermembrane receptor protein